MRVRFKTISAGPKGAIFPGDLVDVSESEAKMLVEGGYADYLTPPVPVDAKETVEASVPARRPRARRERNDV